VVSEQVLKFKANTFERSYKMSAPHGILEGQFMTQSPYFNGQHYNWWKNHMGNYVEADDYELWMIIKNGPLIPKKSLENGSSVPKKSEEFNAEDFRMTEKYVKAKKLLYFGVSPDEYSHISECESAKEIWDALQVAHEGTS